MKYQNAYNALSVVNGTLVEIENKAIL